MPLGMMTHLVVAQRKRAAFATVERLAPILRPHPHEPLRAKHPVQVHRPIHPRDGVLAQDDHPGPDRLRLVVAHEPFHYPVDLLEVLQNLPCGVVRVRLLLYAGAAASPRERRRRGPVLLQAVVEVREVDEGEGGVVLLVDLDGRVGRPLGGFDGRARAPKAMEGEGAQAALELLAQARRARVDVGDL